MNHQRRALEDRVRRAAEQLEAARLESSRLAHGVRQEQSLNQRLVHELEEAQGLLRRARAERLEAASELEATRQAAAELQKASAR